MAEAAPLVLPYAHPALIRATRQRWLRAPDPARLATALVIMLLPGLMLAPAWRLGGLGAGEDDVLYYFPSRAFFADVLARRDWPWFNPYTGLGRPFAADPQSAVWYPGTWLFACFPATTAYPLSLWLHYSLALAGAYRLSRRLGTPRIAGLFGGAAFAFGGFMLAHRAHLAMHHAAAWTPWVLGAFVPVVMRTRVGCAAGAGWAEQLDGAMRADGAEHHDRRCDDDRPKAGRRFRRRRSWLALRVSHFFEPPSATVGRRSGAAWALGVLRTVLPGAFAASMQILAGHLQIAALTALGSLVWLLAARRGGAERSAHTLEATAQSSTAPEAIARSAFLPAGAARTLLASALLTWALVWGLAAGLTAVQLAPTLAYLRECTRTEQNYWDFTQNSWSPLAAVNFALPMFLGQRTPNIFDAPYWGPSHQCEQFGYVGWLPLLLVLMLLSGGAAAWRGPRWRPWLVLLGFAALLALGKYGPICPLLYWLPGASLFRVPARGLVLVDLALAVLAGLTLAHWTRRLPAAGMSAVAGAGATALGAAAADPLPAPGDTRAASRRLAAVIAGVVAALGLCGAALCGATWLMPAARFAEAARTALTIANPALLFPLILLGLSAAALIVLMRRPWRTQARLLALGVLLLDLGVCGWTLDVPADADEMSDALATPDPIATPYPYESAVLNALYQAAGNDDHGWYSFLRHFGARLWVITSRRGDTPGEYIAPTERLISNVNVLYGIAALTNYGPLQPRRYVELAGFLPWGETTDPQRLLRNEELLDACNVGLLLVYDPKLHVPPSFREIFRGRADEWRLLERVESMPPDQEISSRDLGGWPGYATERVTRPGSSLIRNKKVAMSAIRGWWHTQGCVTCVESAIHLLAWRHRFAPAFDRIERLMLDLAEFLKSFEVDSSLLLPCPLEHHMSATRPDKLVVSMLNLPGWTIAEPGWRRDPDTVMLTFHREAGSESAASDQHESFSGVTLIYFPPGLALGARLTALTSMVIFLLAIGARRTLRHAAATTGIIHGTKGATA